MIQYYPDKPVDRSPDDIQEWDRRGCFICQQKIDGWRAIVTFGKEIQVLSRHNKVLPIEPEILEELEQLSKILPEKTVLDGEWLSRRACSKVKKLQPKLYIFDMMRYEGTRLKTMMYERRLDLVRHFQREVWKRLARPSERILLPKQAEKGKFAEFYEAQKKTGHSEGIVVKHKESILIADRKESKKNPLWFKVRYRGGCDGEMDMSHLL